MISSTVTDFEGTRYESSVVCFRIAKNFSRESNIAHGVIDNIGEKKNIYEYVIYLRSVGAASASLTTRSYILNITVYK